MKKRENKAKKKWKLRWRREKRNFEFYRFFIAVYTNKYKKYAYFVFFEKNKYTNAYYFRIKCYICSGNYILSICR